MDKDIRQARLTLAAVCEPGDVAAASIIAACGPVPASGLVTGQRTSAETLERAHAALEVCGYTRPAIALSKAQERWRGRAQAVDTERVDAAARTVGARFLTPESSLWPDRLASLGLAQPIALWVRGEGDLEEISRMRTLSIVGSREATQYGLTVTEAVTTAAAGQQICVISGGAFGIDARAHETALRAERFYPEGSVPTAAVMAGGVNRFYPAAHEGLFLRIMRRGIILTEAAPGNSPTRWRFLQRNRLIAALGDGVVVTEARIRSGALSTAHHALGIGRPVGAVPGGVLTSASSGCHALIRESGAELIAKPEDAIRMLPGTVISAAENCRGFAEDSPASRVTDGMTEEELAVFEATPVQSAADLENIARVAGVPVRSAETVLAAFSLRGLVERKEGRWARANVKR
jgi:DNA processing protein